MFKPSAIKVLKPAPNLSDANVSVTFEGGKEAYDKALKALQKKLRDIQQAYYHQGLRAIVVFEGWDASGKGGAIRRLTEKLDPRGFQVHPISAPTDDEQGRHYLYRFQRRLPPKGSIAIFDRSYYGRVLVERVEEFAAKREWQRAYQEVNEFERMLVDDGARVVKLFLHISAEEQLKRFKQRLSTPAKQWKLTEEDIRNRQKRGDYVKSINDMFARTHTQAAPWQLIASDHKWFARLDSLQHIIEKLGEGVNLKPPPLTPGLLDFANKHL